MLLFWLGCQKVQTQHNFQREIIVLLEILDMIIYLFYFSFSLWCLVFFCANSQSTYCEKGEPEEMRQYSDVTGGVRETGSHIILRSLQLQTQDLNVIWHSVPLSKTPSSSKA